MRFHAFRRLAVGAMFAPLAPLAAQTTASQSSPPAVQPTPATPVAAPAAAAPKEKICAPVLIRAGPNQGQLVSKCHHTERSRADAQPH